MKRKLLALTLAAGLAAAAVPAQAGIIAMSDLYISNLAIRNLTSGGFVTADQISITGGTRFGTDSATLNGTNVSNFSPVVGPTAPADAPVACVGDCGAAAGVYGTLENNFTTHITAPLDFNYALGDMYVSGNALTGGAAGLTRANTSVMDAPATASANGNIQNSISATAIFSALTSFTADFLAVFDTFVSTFIDGIHRDGSGESVATAGSQFVLTVFDLGTTAAPTNIPLLVWLPTEFNQSLSTDTAIDGPNQTFALAGAIDSPDAILIGGHRYQLTITQNSQAGIRATQAIPEPSTLALLGLGLLGFGAIRRRKIY